MLSLRGFTSEAATSGASMPLFARAAGRAAPPGRAFYSVWREPRLLSERGKREGPRSGYIGTEVFLSLVDWRETPVSAHPAPARRAVALHQPRPAAVHAAGKRTAS